MLPVDIIIDQDNKEIRKVYDLSPNTDPSTLPMEQFERDGLLYECTDVLREVIIGSETQTVTQTETVESRQEGYGYDSVPAAAGEGSHHGRGLCRNAYLGFGQHQDRACWLWQFNTSLSLQPGLTQT